MCEPRLLWATRCTAGALACWLLLCMLFGSGLNVCCEQLLSTGKETKMYRSVGKYVDYALLTN